MRCWLESVPLRGSEFLHQECDPRVLALLRIGFASLVLAHWLALLPSVEMLWSEHGILPLADLPAIANGFAPTLFSILPRTDFVLWLAYALLALHAALLLVGYRSRFQLVAVLVLLVSFQNRNPLALNGQDAVLRLIGVFLALAPLGSRWSLDQYLGRPTPAGAPSFPLRFVQAQISIVMLAAGIWKLRGDDWTSGNALYYVTQLDGFWGNLPLPAALHRPDLLRAATFATLAVELTVPLLVWVPHTRRAALLVALLFHASLAYAMNLFLFAPIMMLGWCSFLKAEDLDWLSRARSRGAKWVRGQTMSAEGQPT